MLVKIKTWEAPKKFYACLDMTAKDIREYDKFIEQKGA